MKQLTESETFNTYVKNYFKKLLVCNANTVANFCGSNTQILMFSAYFGVQLRPKHLWPIRQYIFRKYSFFVLFPSKRIVIYDNRSRFKDRSIKINNSSFYLPYYFINSEKKKKIICRHVERDSKMNDINYKPIIIPGLQSHLLYEPWNSSRKNTYQSEKLIHQKTAYQQKKKKKKVFNHTKLTL